MRSSMHPGWLISKLPTGVRVMAHESGKGRPVFLRGFGPSMKITVYRDNGHYDNFTNIDVALRFALSA